MKKILYILITLLCVNFRSIAQSDSNGYFIKGIIDTAVNGILYLSEDIHGSFIDSAKVENGIFCFSGRVSEPIKCGIYYPKFPKVIGRNYIPIFLENANFKIDIHLHPFTYETTGGKLNSIFIKYLRSMNGYFEAWQRVQTILSMDSLWEDSIKTEPIKTELQSVSEYLKEQTKEKIIIFIKRYPDSYVTPLIISHFLLFGSKDVDLAHQYYNKLSTFIKGSLEGKNLKRKIDAIESAPKYGDKLKPFTLLDQNGSSFNFSNPKPGHFTFINFWASWCGPCIQEIPEMKVIFQDYKAFGVEFINVSLDTDKNRWLNAISKNKLSWPQLIESENDSTRLTKIYRINAIPFNFLMDDQMKIIGINLTMHQLRAQLEEIFK